MKDYKWMKLDTASLMFTSLTDSNWGRTFRLSCTLREGSVDPSLLRKAVNDMREIFPSAFTGLRKGFFWNYQEIVSEEAEIREETAEGLLPVTAKYKGRPNFRIVYYGNRVAIEGSHFLGDGNGMKAFFLAIIRRYFELADGKTESLSSYGKTAEMTENAFAKYYEPSGKKDAYSPEEAFHFDETITRKTPELVFLMMEEKQLLELAHSYSMTVTEFYGALLIKAVIDSLEVCPDKPVTIAVPVNLRRFFPSETVRNFVTQTYITFDPAGKKEHTLSEICEATRNQLKSQLNSDNLVKYINKYGSLVNNPVLKIVPNVIKLPVLRMMQKKSHNNVTTIFTNLGEYELDDSMRGRIDRLAFVNGDTGRYGLPVTCSCISCNGILTLCFSHSNDDRSFVRSCAGILADRGINVRVEASGDYGEGNGSRCEKCKVDLSGTYMCCPLCGEKASDGEQKLKNITFYPFPTENKVSPTIVPVKNHSKGIKEKIKGYFNI